jgi:uncharacterized protein GlcG (DUF336 family)
MPKNAHRTGTLIGGAAISGSPGGNDEVCVQAGLDKTKDLLR